MSYLQRLAHPFAGECGRILTLLLPLIIPFSYTYILFEIVITSVLIKNTLFRIRLSQASKQGF
ncbi:hypothetical protein I8H84_04610 [Candidatus Saccharibacteria bacterium]|nr:hypothetical protein [Candidatus Saccharibacteria bacterium]